MDGMLDLVTQVECLDGLGIVGNRFARMNTLFAAVEGRAVSEIEAVTRTADANLSVALVRGTLTGGLRFGSSSIR